MAVRNENELELEVSLTQAGSSVARECKFARGSFEFYE